MGETELLSIIESEEANCLSTTSGKLSEQRRQALQYYYGEPYGNEIEGRSQVVTTEVKDAVEGIMPSLMRIFMSADEIVRFDAQNPDDEDDAQQATDYLNYLFTRQNNGFVVLYCLFKDALLQKTGFTKVYWEDYADQGKEEYENLDDLELALLMQDPELELIEHEAVPGPVDPTTQQPAQFHNVVFRRTKKYGKACIDPCPPEEILISRETPNDLNKARFIEHRTLKSISDIRVMGYEVPDDISDDIQNADFNLERVERNKFDDAWSYTPDKGNSDPSTRRVWLCEAYLKVDYDKDGYAELRKVCKIGRTILKYKESGKLAIDEIDSIPIVGGTAIMMPHKFYGLSIHDLVGDIQLIKSTITRQLLDNAYIANNGTFEVLDGMVNMDDLLTRRPMGIVRTKVLGAMKRVENPLLGQSFYGLLEYFDKVKQNRVGSTDFPNAVDPDAINAKAAFVDKFAEAAMERVNLMARILAETCVKDIFWKLLELVSKHQQKPQMVKLRGKWVQVDPREWKNRFNMTVSVGLGTGSQQTVLQGAMGILQIQDGMLKAGLGGRVVTEKNFFAAAHRFAKSVFPKDADEFFTDPTGLPPPEQQPNVDLLKVQVAAQKAAMGNKQKYDKMMQDYILAMRQMGIDVLSMTNDARLQERDQLHDHSQNIMGHAVDLAKHDKELKSREETARNAAQTS